MSSVKNLLAMFENKGDSPPERGRSPGLTPGTRSSTAGSPRPLSKIRTSFVAIEKDGRVGLQRDPSGGSSVSRRRMSTETDGDLSVLSTENKPASKPEENPKPFKTPIAQNPVPESAQRDSPVGPAKSHPKKSNAVAVPVVTKEPPTPDVPSKFPLKLASEGRKTDEKPKELKEVRDTARINGGSTKKAVENGSNAKETPVPQKAPSKTAQPKLDALAPISTSRPAANTAVKSPGLAKSPLAKTRAKSPAVPEKTTPRIPKTLHADKPTQPNDSQPPRARTPLQPAKQPAASAKKPQPIHTSPPTSFVKPKPKSPTKPVKLPVSLTAPTASSVSKNLGGHQPLSRASVHPNLTVGRSPSRASVAGSPAAKPQRPLKRQSSVINRPRPSLGPPPKQPAKDYPIARKEREIDENFLARMMRPTQSYAQKVQDKVPITPPRKSAAKRQGADYHNLVARRSAPTKRETPSRDSSAAPESKASDETKVITPSSKASVSQVASVCEEALTSPPREDKTGMQSKEPSQDDVVRDVHTPVDHPAQAPSADATPEAAEAEPNKEQPSSLAPSLETADATDDTMTAEESAEATVVGGDAQAVEEKDPATPHEISESQGDETMVAVDSGADDTQVEIEKEDVEGISKTEAVGAEAKTETADAEVEDTANAEVVALKE